MEETAIIMKEAREQLEVKKLVVILVGLEGVVVLVALMGKMLVAMTSQSARGMGRLVSVINQKGIKCSHVAPKQNNGGKGKRKWGKW